MTRRKLNPPPKAVSAPQTSHAWLKSWAAYGSFILIAFIVYIPAITTGFIWDDDVMLTANKAVKASDGLRRIWFTMEQSDYYPLTSTSFWIEWRLWGMNPIGYNVMSIFQHALGAMLLWRVLLRLKVPCAWLCATLFMVHPVCVASVDWIAERKNTLSLVFYLLALLLYLRFSDEKRARWYGLSLFMFLLALLSKTSVVVLPLVLLLCAWWREGTITKRDIRLSAPFFLLSLVLGAVTVWVQLHEVLLGQRAQTDRLFSRLVDGSWAIWFYLGKVLWPTKLSMIYQYWDIDESKWISYLPAVLWMAMLAVAWRFRRSWGRPLLFGLGYFTIALLPVLGFFDMDYLNFSQVADHLQYIAIPGVVALVVGLSLAAWHKLKAHFSWNTRTPGYCAAASAMVVLGILTWKQASVYYDDETLWRDVIRKYPTAWVAYINLADRLSELHRFGEAASYYQQALKLKPTYAKGHNNLGNCLHVLGHLDEAIVEFANAIQHKPELADAHYNLGSAQYWKKEYAKALESLNKAIELKPDYPQAYFMAGNAAFNLNNLDRALDYYFSGVRYDPTNADLLCNIGIILSARGQTNQAVDYLKRTLHLAPNHNLARKELHVLLANTAVHQ